MASGNDHLPVNGNGPTGSAVAQVPPVNNSTIDTTLSDTWLIVRKRKWIIASAGLLGIIIGVLTALSTPREYQSDGDIQVRPGTSNQYRIEGSEQALGGDDISVRLETEVTILQSAALMKQVARQLNLQDNMDFMGSKKPLPHTDLEGPTVLPQVLRNFRSGLAVKRMPKTELIAISFQSTSPELSARIVNTLVADYIDRSFQVRFASTQQVSRWLGHQLDDLKDEVENNQEKMIALQRQLGVIGLDDKHNLIADELENLTKSATDAKLGRIVNETRFRVLEETDPNLLEPEVAVPLGTGGGGSNTLVSVLRGQEATEEATISQLATTYGPNWPPVQQAKAQLDSIRKEIKVEQQRLIEQSRVAFTAAKENEDKANDALNEKETEAYATRDALVQYAILQRRFESSRDLYEGLTRRLREAGIQAGLQSSEIDIVDFADIPTNATGPRRAAIVLLSGVFGIIGGLALAFLLESLDTSLRSIAEIETVMELPSLAVIPRARRNMTRVAGTETAPAYQRNIDVLSQPKSQFSEAFRSLRTSLLLSTVGHPPRVVLITSSIPSEGKTTVATNIAAALSQRDVRVLLIDSDLRRPTVHHRFGLSAKKGLTTVLANTTTFEESVQRIPLLPNLDILASGPVPPFPTEMIASERMLQLLEDAKGKYEHIVIDSPPILSVTDGVILARLADAVALVMRHGGVGKHIARRSRDLLLRAGAPVTGIILNAVDLSSPDYYGYYGYYRYSYISATDPTWSADEDLQPGKPPPSPGLKNGQNGHRGDMDV